MTNNRGVLFVILAALATSACHRKDHNGNPVVGGIPGGGVTTIAHYAGATSGWPCGGQTCRQSVTVDADVIDYPYDRLDVYLCRNADCSTGNLPSQTCAQAWNDPTASCYTSTPSAQIVFGKNLVQFINANQPNSGFTPPIPGYSNYYISTTVTR